MDQDNELSDKVDTILDQLKQNPSLIKKAQTIKEDCDDEITCENIDKFIMQHSKELIRNASEAVEHVKDIVTSAPTPDDIEALSQLVASTASAIDILNKMSINKSKIKNSVRLKEMEIKAKVQQLESGNTQVNNTVLIATREDIMKQLFSKAKEVIEIEPVIDPH